VTCLLFAQQTSVAIIGAGLAGLICARTLVTHGFQVTVFDKGRRPGGRMSTRQTDVGLFDHGCQFLTGTDPSFLAALDAWNKANVVRIWDGRLAKLDGENTAEVSLKAVRYIGANGMQSVCWDLAHGLDVRSGVEIKSVQRTETGWFLADADGRTQGLFDAIVVATPPIQAANLLQAAPHLATIARSVPMSPCWTVMAKFRQRIPLLADAAVIRNSALAWAARSGGGSSGKDGDDSWVLQASPEWSQQQLEESKTMVENALLNSFFIAAGCAEQTPSYVAAHRWRYALCSQPLTAGSLTDAASGIAVCGDWCLGSNAEAAYLSGLAAANALLIRRGDSAG